MSKENKKVKVEYSVWKVVRYDRTVRLTDKEWEVIQGMGYHAKQEALSANAKGSWVGHETENHCYDWKVTKVTEGRTPRERALARLTSEFFWDECLELFHEVKGKAFLKPDQREWGMDKEYGEIRSGTIQECVDYWTSLDTVGGQVIMRLSSAELMRLPEPVAEVIMSAPARKAVVDAYGK